ncbi:MAG: protein kinase [Planctomycetia bacterium]|nr:protein kinase [Planctomycetia bacterium]
MRRGERPTADEYARRYPDFAGRILELFPTIALMERVEPAAGPRLVERPGMQIGAYKLLEQIGEGAFGVVFMAEQSKPVRRKVALKVLKPGMDTKQVVARFAAERQALAMMDHPHIAKVLDAGETESGRPYFVMELVRGVAITEYCDVNQMPPRERLELFAQVCRAVQHAHLKGIIHRDLKPSNVLVTLMDGAPTPIVIDFGVAKAIDSPLTERTLFTHFAQVVGTPLYMSPEQAELSGLDVDTRSDIYSLGVLLYELLTGLTPFDRERFRTVGIDEVRRIIREEEPPRPSARLAMRASAKSSGAEGRAEDLRRQSAAFRSELDWIVMKCLEKDRRRRYETAVGLVLDVQRYLRDEPVQACPPSTWYRLRKFVSRNKAASLAAAGVLLAFTLGFITLAMSNYLIRAEQARTKAERDRFEQAQKLAEDRAGEIRQGLERLTAANALLDRGNWFTTQERWDDAHDAFSKAIELHGEHVSVWVARGDLYASLGLWDLASADFGKAMAIQEPDATMRWYRQALLLLYLGDLPGYDRTRQRMQERFHRTLDINLAGELARTCVLSSNPPADFRPLVQLAREAKTADPGGWFRGYVLGAALYRDGQYQPAVESLTDSLTGDPDWSVRALSLPILAMAQHRVGQIEVAKQTLDKAIESHELWIQIRYDAERTNWRRHWVHNQGASADWPIAWWDWLEFQISCREAWALIHGEQRPMDPRLQVMRARAFASLRKNFTADMEYAKALKLLPEDAEVRLEFHRSAGYSAVGRRDWRLAATEFAQASALAPEDPTMWRFVATAHFAAGDRDAYRRVCAAMVRQFERNNEPRTAGELLRSCALSADSLDDMSQLLEFSRTSDVLWHWGAWARGSALYRVGKYEACVECFDAAAKIHVPRAWDWCFLAMAHSRLGHVHDAERCLAEAERWIDAANHRHNDPKLGGGDDVSLTKPDWMEWGDPVLYAALLQEARELIRGQKQEATRRESSANDSL